MRLSKRTVTQVVGTTPVVIPQIKTGNQYTFKKTGDDLTLEEFINGAWVEVSGSPLTGVFEDIYIGHTEDQSGVRVTSTGSSVVSFSLINYRH